MAELEFTVDETSDFDLQSEIEDELGRDIRLNPLSGDIAIGNGFNFGIVEREDCREQTLLNVIKRKSSGYYNNGFGGDLHEAYNKPGNLDLHYIKNNINSKVLPNFFTVKSIDITKYNFSDAGERKSQILLNVITESDKEIAIKI